MTMKYQFLCAHVVCVCLDFTLKVVPRAGIGLFFAITVLCPSGWKVVSDSGSVDDCYAEPYIIFAVNQHCQHPSRSTLVDNGLC